MLRSTTGMGIVCLWLFSFAILGETLHVPSQYPTIHDGLNAAQTGDTVLVAAGTYMENVVWPTRDGIVLVSEHGPDSTIIDGGGAARVVTFPDFAFTQTTVITGFAIQNGSAVRGAGIYICGSPHIFQNVIQRNIATASSGHVHGGGICCDGAGTPLIERNLVCQNVATGPSYNFGAGIFVGEQNSASVFGNLIEADTAIGGSWNRGAGIYCASESRPDIRHNIIQNNVALQGSEGSGAGIYVWMHSNAYILSNLVCNNTLQSEIWNYGAGIYINRGVVVLNNTIVDNRCVGGSLRRGGGIYVHDSTNTIGNNIIVNNRAAYGGGISAGNNGSGVLLNNDVWNNVGGDYYGIAPGSNDISSDPLFATGPLGSFYLSQVAAGQGEDSPCVDYGFASAESLGLDTYTTRTDTVPDSGAVDLGYHYPTGSSVPVEEETEDGRIWISLFEVFPSVSSSSYRVQLALDSPQYVEVQIFDALGRLKETLAKEELASGKHRWSWNGLDREGNEVPSGVYFLIAAGEQREILSTKVVLIR